MEKFSYEQWTAVGKFASKQTQSRETCLFIKKPLRTYSPANKDTATAVARRKAAV